MSHLICPLCGLSVPLGTFWEGVGEDVEDIEAVSFRGLGRGRGFEKTGPFSVLHNEDVTSRVASRCHAILKLLGEYQWLDSLLKSINGILGDIYDEEFTDLSSAVEALIEEYLDAVEEAEDEA